MEQRGTSGVVETLWAHFLLFRLNLARNLRKVMLVMAAAESDTSCKDFISKNIFYCEFTTVKCLYL